MGRLALSVVTAGAVALTAGVVATTSAQADQRAPRVTLMTRNLYLGASLTPALAATDPTSFLLAVARIYGTAQFTNFPVRAQAVAAEIDAARPDLVGLQEVTRWQTSGPGVPPTQDFLLILQAALADRGLHYSVAAVAENANIGPVPLVSPCGSATVGACLVTLQDRDVILVNDDRAGLTWSDPQSGSYTAQQEFQPPVPGAPPVSFKRGWASIHGQLDGVAFHFANTHLETEDFPTVQEAQAAEFLAGPAFGPGIDLATGDFNSAADGSTTSSYSLLTAKNAFVDAWRVNDSDPGLSCCENETLTNPVPDLHTRIDLVLSNGAPPVSARLVGVAPFQAAPPLYASDHAGVVATIQLTKAPARG